MFVLKQMRKNLKMKIDEIVDMLGPEMIQNFEKERVLKKKNANDGKSKNDEKTIDDTTEYHVELELNNVFESLRETGAM